MTREEFQQWIADLRARFPDIGTWINQLEDSQKTLDIWFDIAFCGFTLEEAKSASCRIQDGTVDLPRWKWQEIPMVYRKIVVAIRQDQISVDQWTAPDLDTRRERCTLCHDRGYVRCWHVETMKFARRHVLFGMDQAKVPWYETDVVCSCSAGDKRSTWHMKHGDDVELPRYNPEQWLRLTGDSLEDRAALFTWAENYQSPNIDFREFAGN